MPVHQRLALPLCLLILLATPSVWAGSSRTDRVKGNVSNDARATGIELDDDMSPAANLRRSSVPGTDRRRAVTDPEAPLYDDGDSTPVVKRRQVSTLPDAPSSKQSVAPDKAASGRKAEPVTPSPGPERVSVLDICGKLCAMLLCVFGLFSGVKLFKGRGISWLQLPRVQATGGSLHVLETLPLGGSRCLYLVQAGERTVLLGADSTGLAALSDFGATSAASTQSGRAQDVTALLQSRGDTSEFAPTTSGAPSDCETGRRPMRPEIPAPSTPTRSQAQERRDEESWARKRDLLIQALKEHTAG